ncbi:MAG TPA: citrate synthase, partial [Anaerolineae bacterium]|nr:citrate synthase [Anaerolineae bacterium]
MTEVNKGRYCSAREAAAMLGVTRATLYAYVSRGLLRSEEAPGKTRAKRYLVTDVEALLRRKAGRQNPEQVAEEALSWGMPVLESAITLIDDGQIYYRGVGLMAVVANYTVEETAVLLWLGPEPEPELSADKLFAQEMPVLPAELLSADWLAGLTPVERFQTLLPLAGAQDYAAYDLRPAAVARTGARILKLLVAIVTGRAPDGDSLVAHLATHWAGARPEAAGRPEAAARPEAAELLHLALVLSADHELNASSFTARVVAGTQSTPYNAVLGGLAALRGARHGGYAERVEALWREVGAAERAEGVLAARLKRGEEIPGFTHPLYPEGDPRGRALLAAAARTWPDDEGVGRLVAMAT